MKGTEKQIKWAEDIIADAMQMSATAVYRGINAALINLRTQDADGFGRAVTALQSCTTTEGLVEAFRAWASGIEDARIAIDNHGMMVEAFVASLAK